MKNPKKKENFANTISNRVHYFFVVRRKHIYIIVVVIFSCGFRGASGRRGEIGSFVGEQGPFLVGERFDVIVPSEHVGSLGLGRLNRGERVHVGLGRFVAGHKNNEKRQARQTY